MDGPTTDGLEHYIRELGGRIVSLRNPYEYLSVVGEALVSLRQLRFEEEAGPDGIPWAPLKPATVKRKGGDTILQDTGKLVGSLNYTVDLETKSVFVTAGVDYAIYHQQPEGRGSKMPFRPFLGFDERDLERIGLIRADWIARVMGGAS